MVLLSYQIRLTGNNNCATIMNQQQINELCHVFQKETFVNYDKGLYSPASTRTSSKHLLQAV